MSLLSVFPFLIGGILLTLLWVHVSGQAEVSQSWRFSLAVSVRIFVLYVVTWAVAIYGMGLPLDAVCIVVTLSLVVMNIMTLGPRTGEFSKSLDAEFGAIIFALAMMLLIPLHVLRQLILQVPDRDLLAEEPVSNRSAKELDSSLLGTRAIVASSLKPSGMIDVNGRKFDAYSDDGSFLSAGTEVIICGERRGLPLVKRVPIS